MAKYGGSLLVPSVKELAENPMVAVPPRYIRPKQDAPVISDNTLISKFPVIDMESLLSEESMDSELAKLDFACREWGFFQLVNHGVSLALVDKVKKEIQEFFNLSMEEKKKYWQYPGEVEGFGQAFVVSEEQKLDWGDLFFMTTLPVHLRKPHLFPKLPPSLRDTLEVYSMEVNALAMNLISGMAKVLHIKDEEVREFFENGLQSMRMNYYPPCPQPEKVTGLTPHSDAVALTILLQINEAEGLQIKKDGKWFPIRPLPNAFIVNIGDVLEVITNGVYPSIEHRAVVNSEQERLSIATFHTVNYDGEVGPAPSLITEKTPALFRRVTTEEFVKALFSLFKQKQQQKLELKAGSTLSEPTRPRLELLYKQHEEDNIQEEQLHQMMSFANFPVQLQVKLTIVASSWPFAQWGIDLIGPLPKGRGAATHAVVAVDYFTKWIEVETLSRIIENKITDFMWRNIVCRYGIPYALIEDNGRQFDNHNFREFCQNLGIKLKFCSLAHPQSNGQVEAANKVIKKLLKTILVVVPAEIEATTHQTEHFEENENHDQICLNLDLLTKKRKLASKRPAAYQQRVARYYNRKVQVRQLRAGDWVLRKVNHSTKDSTQGVLGPN
ncbi:protein SRG1 [Citrus sinensis]|uniref:Protein SRG1 n=1 Tax=Citrus sinensis TaxID=2711 RepID=A0ACB8M0P7_CITSI|nr:protein SRG1 [Citrus sinensis]